RGLIKDGAPHAPAQERLDRLQGLIGGDGRSALLNSGDDFNHIALADLMNASTGPGLANLPTKQSPNLGRGAVLCQTFGNEGLQQILDSICNEPSLCLPLLSRGIAAIQLCCEYFLCRHMGLMKRHAPIGPDRIFAQLRTCAAGAVENNEHLAALRCDLQPEARAAGVPVDYVG